MMGVDQGGMRLRAGDIDCSGDVRGHQGVFRTSKASFFPPKACTSIFPAVPWQIKTTEYRLRQGHIISFIFRQHNCCRSSWIRC